MATPPDGSGVCVFSWKCVATPPDGSGVCVFLGSVWQHRQMTVGVCVFSWKCVATPLDSSGVCAFIWKCLATPPDGSGVCVFSQLFASSFPGLFYPNIFINFTFSIG